MRLRLPLHGRDHRRGGADPIPGIGGYVFLEEIVLASDGDPMVFSDIPQIYRHLVIEASLAVAAGAGLPRNLAIFLSGVDYSFALVDGDGTSPGTTAGTDHAYVEATGILPPVALGTLPNFNAFTAKLPYYATDDRVHGILWQAISFPTTDTVKSATGGGLTMGDDSTGSIAPITEISLEARSVNNMAAGCSASLYGIE